VKEMKLEIRSETKSTKQRGHFHFVRFTQTWKDVRQVNRKVLILKLKRTDQISLFPSFPGNSSWKPLLNL